MQVEFSEIGAALEQLAASASEVHNLSAKVAEGASMAKVGGEELHEIVLRLQRMAGDAKILALNAEIEASRGTTEVHRTFKVIASELGKFSKLFQEIFTEVDKKVSMMTQAASDGETGANLAASATQEQAAAIEEITASFENILNSIKE